VRDNGIGIAPEYHDRIFRIFNRLHGQELPGTGIGLAICKRIVDHYGGRFWLESEVGRGSIFSFSFPAERDNCAQEYSANAYDHDPRRQRGGCVSS
jgi:signal transduction histidine kinase